MESPETLQYIFDTLAGRNGIGAPCAPFNPFGNIPFPGSLEFAFPSIIDGNNNSQTAMSLARVRRCQDLGPSDVVASGTIAPARG